MKYINCSLIKFNSYIRYLICSTFPSMTSSISCIQSINSLLTELPGLIKMVLSNLKTAIGLNITLLCLHITPIWNIVKCFNKEIHNAVNIIKCINNLINSKCKLSIIVCFQQCLNQIKSKFIELHPIFLELRDKFGEIKHLIDDSSKALVCPMDIPTLKTKICKLIKAFNCSLKEFKCIELKIKCIKCIISQIKEKKQELCKQFDNITSTICINIKFTLWIIPFSISSLTKESLKKKMECLTGKIEKICSEFTTIENNSIGLKHSLMFNEMYLKISMYILNELECIESQQKILCSKLSEVKDIPSPINVISDNVNYVKSMIEGINEGANDLSYLRDTMKYIMPKLCQIKESATKIKGLECVVDGLKKIKSSIENLKKVEYEEKCLQILECYDGISIKTLTCITDKLYIKCITERLSTVQKGISSLNFVICNIKNLLGYFENIENILSVIEYLKRNISKLANKLLRCSLESLSNQIIDRKISKMRVAEVDNPVMNMYSVLSVMDYWVVVNRLYDSSKKIDQILKLHINIHKCKCILGLEKSNKIEIKQINVQKIIEQVTKEKGNNNNDLKLDEIKKLHGSDTKDNHLCLCMVFKYVLYPQIINLTYIMSVDLRALSTISRKFSKYRLTKGWKVNLSQFFIVCVELLYKLSMYILLKYKYSWVSGHPFHVKCFCMYSDDSNYYRVVSIILVLSSLIENICAMETESLRTAIECLSTLMSEFDMIDSHTNNRSFITMNLFKLSFVSALSSSTQSCKMLAKLRIIIDFFSLLKEVPYLDSLIKPYIKNISFCNIFHFDKILNQLKGYDKTKDYINWVLKLYKSVGSDSKGFNKSNCCCSICVNLIILWVSIYIWLKVNIKLHESKTRYKERLEILLKRICNCGDDCCCKELQKSCEDLCCGSKCGGECVCNKLPDLCKKICGNDGNCLCKEITETFNKCTDGTCECKDKEGCCRCPPCKILAQSVRILSRASKLNVLEPYKRITIELLNSTKNKKDVIRTIVEGINRTTLNNIYLVKNSYSSYPYSIGSYTATIDGVTNVETRHWGYDTKYEHDVSTDKSFAKGDGYPNLIDPSYTFSHLPIFT